MAVQREVFGGGYAPFLVRAAKRFKVEAVLCDAWPRASGWSGSVPGPVYEAPSGFGAASSSKEVGSLEKVMVHVYGRWRKGIALRSTPTKVIVLVRNLSTGNAHVRAERYQDVMVKGVQSVRADSRR